MILSDFLSRQTHDNSNPHEIILISLNMHNILHKRYYNIGKLERYLVQTHCQTKSSRIILPDIHGVSMNLDANIQPEKQAIRPLKGNEISQEKPRIGQGRVGSRRRKPPINQKYFSVSRTIKEKSQSIKNRKESHKSTRFHNPSTINKQF